jgi:hypothetical protein
LALAPLELDQGVNVAINTAFAVSGRAKIAKGRGAEPGQHLSLSGQHVEYIIALHSYILW